MIVAIFISAIITGRSTGSERSSAVALSEPLRLSQYLLVPSSPDEVKDLRLLKAAASTGRLTTSSIKHVEGDAIVLRWKAMVGFLTKELSTTQAHILHIF